MDLHQLAVHDVVSAAEARSIGLDPSALRRMVRAGEIQRLIRGWYAVCSPEAPQPPWVGNDDFDTARRRHRLLTVALLRSFEGRVVASHQSALVLHHGRLWRPDLTTAHLCRTESDHSRHRRQAVIHPSVDLPPASTPDGLATVPLATAVVQVGLVSIGIGLPPFPLESLVAADGALCDGLITHDELKAAVEAHSHHPGIPAVRALLEHADGRHESAGETRLAHAMRLLGYQFTPQVPINAGARQWRVDFELDDEPVIIEFDGLSKYTLGVDRPTPQQMRQALTEEKWREDRLTEQGREVVRFVWADLDDLRRIERRIDGAILRARGRGARPT